MQFELCNSDCKRHCLCSSQSPGRGHMQAHPCLRATSMKMTAMPHLLMPSAAGGVKVPLLLLPCQDQAQMLHQVKAFWMYPTLQYHDGKQNHTSLKFHILCCHVSHPATYQHLPGLCNRGQWCLNSSASPAHLLSCTLFPEVYQDVCVGLHNAKPYLDLPYICLAVSMTAAIVTTCHIMSLSSR